MAAHPTQDELSGFLLGKLTADASEVVAEHLGHCPPCQDTIHHLEAHKDTLLNGLSAMAPESHENDPECRRAVTNASALLPASVAANAPPVEATAASIAAVKSGGLSREQFIAQLTSAEIIDADEWSRLRQENSAISQAADGQALARALVQAGSLTKFQAALVYQGKAKNLVFGEYIVLDKIGEGGMGQVFKARHRSMDRIVALKVLAKAAMNSPDAVKRFQREVKAAAKLIHPNIVTAFDAGKQDGVHFLVMEYVPGSDLSSFVKNQGPLAIERAVSFTQQAARGLAFAHSKGVVHRDIKPGNLLVDGDDVVKILDMGLARLDGDTANAGARDGLTQTGQVMGTVDYMAPEQAFDTSRADAKADMYSLGCTLYRLLTGNNLFAGDTLVQKILNHREQAIPSLREARPEVSPQLDAIYRRMVAKKPEDRPTMAELVAEFEALAAKPQANDSAARAVVIDTGVKPVSRDAKPSASGREAQRSAPPAKPQANHGAGRGKKPPIKWIAAAAGAAALLLFGVWVIFKDKDGNTTGMAYNKDATNVEVVPGDKPTAIGEPEATATGGLSATVPTIPDFTAAAAFNVPGANASGSPSGAPVAYVVAGPAVDLFQHIDVAKAELDKKGKPDWLWEVERKVLLCDTSNSTTRISVDYSVPEAYVLEARVTPQSEGRMRTAEIGLRQGEQRFWFEIDRPNNGNNQDPGPWTGPALLDGFPVGRHEASLKGTHLNVGKTLTVRIEVRPDGLLASFDGKPIVEFRGPMNRLSLGNRSELLSDLGDLWLASHERTLFESLTLTPLKPAAPTSSPSAAHRGGFALQFEGSGRVTLPPLGLDFTKPFTVEAYAEPQRSGTRGHLLSVGPPELGLRIDTENCWELFAVGVGQIKSEPTTIGRRTHVAVVVDLGRAGLFVDGKKIDDKAWNNDKMATFNQSPGTLGRDFVGALSEVRISQTARYKDDFTPQARFETDAATLALYHVDEGAGDVLHDASGNDHDGKIVGAKWLPLAMADAGGTNLLTPEFVDHLLKEIPGWSKSPDGLVVEHTNQRSPNADFKNWNPAETVLRARVRRITANTDPKFYPSFSIGFREGWDLPEVRGRHTINPVDGKAEWRIEANTIGGGWENAKTVARVASTTRVEDEHVVEFRFAGGTAELLVDGVEVLRAENIAVNPNSAHLGFQNSKWQVMSWTSQAPAADLKSQISNLQSPTPFELLTSPDYVWSAPTNLGPVVNSPANDSDPCLSADGLSLIFASNRAGGTSGSDLYICTRADVDAAWSAPRLIDDAQINSDRHEGGPCVSTDGLTLFYYRADRPGSAVADLFTATKPNVKARWSAPASLATVNSSTYDYSPSISADGLELYFHTGRAGKNSELFVSRRKNLAESFGAPESIGAPNSPALEYDPCISSDGRVLIFFSSRPGDPALGTLWLSVRADRQSPWSPAAQLNIPADSVGAFGPALSADGGTLVFHSSRPGGQGNDDLWMVRRVKKK